MELSTMTTASTFFESHIVGVRFSGTAACERMTWSAGWFNNWLDDELSFSESGQIAAGRVTGTPILADGGRRLLHLGVSAVYREAPNGSLKSRSIPEVYGAPDLVNGRVPGGPRHIGRRRARGGRGALHGLGGIHGDARIVAADRQPRLLGLLRRGLLVFDRRDPAVRPLQRNFRENPSKAPFSFKHGGPGAWVLAARYSSIDLTSGSIDGGRFDRLGGALSWYPNQRWRFEFDYGYGNRAAGLVGHTHFYQLRLQFQL